LDKKIDEKLHGGDALSSDKKKHRRKVKTHWAKKRRKAARALRRRGR
jgi:hypothetical protein